MKLGSLLDNYRQYIFDGVKSYAYENYNLEPLLEFVHVDWSGEIFDVSNIENDLHEDILEDLRATGQWTEIINKLDKFVILPDVFSEKSYPIIKDRNQFDTDRRNVVIINGNVLEYHMQNMVYTIYNHNKKTYLFYNNQSSNGIFETKQGEKPSMSALFTYEYSFMYDDKKNTTWNDTFRYHLNLDANNHWIPDDEVDKRNVGVSIVSPYMIFDFEKEIDPSQIAGNIPGLLSTTWDVYIQHRLYGVDFDIVYIHNRQVLFSNTYLIKYKDGTYKIENTYVNKKGDVIEKIDKHSIKLKYDSEIKEVVVFLRPFIYKDHRRFDSLYDKAMVINNKSNQLMSKYQKYTNNLYNQLRSDTMSVEDIIEWGYKYDTDVLKTIQNLFPLCLKLPKENWDITKTIDYPDKKFYQNKLVIRVENKLDLYPNVFINNKAIMSNYSIFKAFDIDIIVIDLAELMTYFTNIDWDIKNIDDVILLKEKDKVKTILEPFINSIHIVFSKYKMLHKDPDMYQSGRIFREPFYRFELVWDRYTDFKYNEGDFGGVQFVNGRLNSEFFTYDTSDVAVNPYLFRTLDGVQLFDFDNDSTDFVVGTTTNDSDIYHPNYTLDDGRYSIYQDYQNMSLLINRTTEKLYGVSKVYFGDKFFTQVYSIDSVAGLQPIPNEMYMNEYSTVSFDKYGYLANDSLDVLSNKYINFVGSYNYKPNKYIDNNIVANIFPMTLDNPKLDISLEIDLSLIGPDNVGSFNENCMNDVEIYALFTPRKVTEIREIPINLKSVDQLLGEKILTRYYLSCLENPYNTTKYSSEVSILSGVYVNSNGTLGVVPPINNTFILSNDERGDLDFSLNQKYIAENVLYNIIFDTADFPENRPYVISKILHNLDPDVVLDTNITTIQYAGSAKLEHYMNGLSNISTRLSSDTFINILK